VIPWPIRTIDLPETLLLKLRECFREDPANSNNSSNRRQLPEPGQDRQE
jgi:hypothetical protein